MAELDNILKDMENLLQKASEYKKMYEAERARFPYRINVISELHDNENAHSRILLQLLRFVDGGKYSILESFIKMLQGVCETKVSIDVTKPTITDQYEFIDGFIAEKKKYALIIENKIWGAVDQMEQIQRYVDSAKGYSDNIYVVYLTMDGTKTVAEYSLTDKAKKVLDDGHRFIPISYKYDIIPWLKEEVYPNCKIKEEYLQSAIHQYVDYLEDINGLHDYQQKIKKAILNKLFPNSNTTNKMERYKEINERLNEISKLQALLQGEKDKMVKSVMDKFTQLTSEILGDDFTVNDRAARFGFYQIWKKNWNNYVHFEWIPLTPDIMFNETNAYTLVLHVEGGLAKDSFGKTLTQNETLAEINQKNRWVIKKVTFYSKVFKCGKPLGMMNEDEMRDYLTNIYRSDDITSIIEMVDETFKIIK